MLPNHASSLLRGGHTSTYSRPMPFPLLPLRQAMCPPSPADASPFPWPVPIRHVASRGMAVCAVASEAVASRTHHALLSTAREFVDLWSQGCKTNRPNQLLLDDLSCICSPDIRVQAVHPLGNVEFRGLDGLQRKLVQDANITSSMRPSRILLAAVDDEQRSVFCLLECEEGGSMDEDVSTITLELHPVGRTYGIVKMDIEVDAGGTAVVTGVTERMQLGPADACLLSMLYPHHNLNEMKDIEHDEHRDAAGRLGLQLASIWQFPREDIRATPLKGPAIEAARQSIRTWCEARCSGKDAGVLLEGIVDKSKFRLWDPFGVLPTVCGIRDAQGNCTFKGIEADSHSNCVMSLDATVNRLHAIKEDYLIKCDLMGSAICTHHNVGFVYWHSSMRHIVHTQAGPVVDTEHDHPIEAMALFIFHHDGKIRDAWVLRDPYEVEAQILEGMCMAPQMTQL